MIAICTMAKFVTSTPCNALRIVAKGTRLRGSPGTKQITLTEAMKKLQPITLTRYWSACNSASINAESAQT